MAHFRRETRAQRERDRDAPREARVTAAADALVSSGLRDAGYIYVNLDDCWQALMRNPVTGELLADPLRFPSGIKARQWPAVGAGRAVQPPPH